MASSSAGTDGPEPTVALRLSLAQAERLQAILDDVALAMEGPDEEELAGIRFDLDEAVRALKSASVTKGGPHGSAG